MIKWASNIFKRSKIRTICRKFRIKNYIINPDLSIDVDGSVCFESEYYNYSGISLTKLPLKFNYVSGDFGCSHTRLTSLEGAPKYVGGNFICNNNKLNNLIGGPQKVGGSFYCQNNQLTTLIGAPTEVGSDFLCHRNELNNLIGAPKVSGVFFIYPCQGDKIPEQLENTNSRTLKLIVKYQDEYSIWKKDGTLNEYRFEEMMKDILF